MAKVIFREAGQPPVKSDYKPKSRVYRRLLVASATLNISQILIILFLLANK